MSTIRVLVTGFNARTASPKRATRDTCFAALLVSALREMGVVVDHRDTRVGESIEDYDHVFVGVASPLAVSSNRTYGALSTIGMAWPKGNCTFFLDDPDVSKIVHGLASLQRKPEQFTKDFFSSRVDYSVANEPEWREWLLHVADRLRHGLWPTLLVPAFSWSSVVPMLMTMPNTMQGNATGLDLSTYMSEHAIPPIKRDEYWVTEESFKSTWVRDLRLHQPVKSLGRVYDDRRVLEYAAATGVLERSLAPHAAGWFRPRMVLALRAGAVYITRWQSMTSVGTMFTQLPHTVEQMSPDERDRLALDQRDRFEELQQTKDEVQSTLRTVLNITDVVESAS